MGRRKQMILACGGPRVSNELAKELGYDAGFSKGTYPHHVASFIVRELAARLGEQAAAATDDGLAASADGRLRPGAVNGSSASEASRASATDA